MCSSVMFQASGPVLSVAPAVSFPFTFPDPLPGGCSEPVGNRSCSALRAGDHGQARRRWVGQEVHRPLP